MKDRPIDYLYVPVRRDLVQEFFRRHARWEEVNIAVYVENIIEGFLDSTAGEPDQWTSDDYLEDYAHDIEVEKKTREKYGPSNKGYQWKTLFLPNGTKLRMNYKGADHYAEVRHEQIHYQGETSYEEGRPFTPSLLATKIASGTSRNAWRDLFIQRPHERDWVLADVARRGQADSR